MARNIEYCLNQVDVHGDIHDIEFYDTLKEAKRASEILAHGDYLAPDYLDKEYNMIEKRIVYGNDDEGITDMQYVATWMLNASTSKWEKLK